MHKPVIIQTERLVLRPHGLDDFHDMVKLWSAPEVTQFTSGNRPCTEEECWQRLLRYRGLWALLGFGYFAISLKESGTFIGEAGLADFHREIEPSLTGLAEAGWALMPQYWGQGYAQEALQAIFAWYGNTPNPRPVLCIINPDNLISIKLAEKVGFRMKAETTYRASPCLMFEQ